VVALNTNARAACFQVSIVGLTSQHELVFSSCMIQAVRRKASANSCIRKLRQILGRSQVAFAALVGVSTDTVISWENGRNQLSREKARCIHVATGVRIAELLEGKGQLRNMDGAPYVLADFNEWHRTYLGVTDPTRAEYFAKQGFITLWLLFHAAAVPGPGKIKNRLPAVWISFQEWAEQAADNGQLKPQIKALLKAHKQGWLRKQSAQAHAILDRDRAQTRPRHVLR
jgi:DNA-binding transcriptional regulator YiaG